MCVPTVHTSQRSSTPTYNAAGQTVRLTSPLGFSVTSVYDAGGRRVALPCTSRNWGFPREFSPKQA